MRGAISFLFCLIFSVAASAQEASKIDEFESLGCDEYLARMDGAINEARQNPSSTIFVLIYEGKEPKYNEVKKKIEQVFPNFRSAEAKTRSIKKWLLHRELPIERFSFVKAGFRENLTVEIWNVPEGALPPKPTPTLTKIKYRKGKPKGFCTDCCGS
ncbi:MAG: hypothetical protein WKF92_15330 [Pyrinomonadaceae bacterium]